MNVSRVNGLLWGSLGSRVLEGIDNGKSEMTVPKLLTRPKRLALTPLA